MKRFPQKRDLEEIILEREHQAGVVTAMAFSWIVLVLLMIGFFIYLC